MKKRYIISLLLILTLSCSTFIGCSFGKESSNKDNSSKTQTSFDKEKANKDASVKDSKDLKISFENLLNEYLRAENKYIVGDATSISTLTKFLSSDSYLKDKYKDIEDKSKITTPIIYQQLGSSYDEIENIEMTSSKTAKITAKRYMQLSQTSQQAYFLKYLQYDLILENDQWLIKDLKTLGPEVKPANIKLVSKPVVTAKLQKSIEDYKKSFEDKNKIDSIVQVVQYNDRILVTTLESNQDSKGVLNNYFISPLTYKIVMTDSLIYTSTIIKAIDEKDFKPTYDKVRNILNAEKPLYASNNYSNKNAIIASILIANNEYIVSYYDEYKLDKSFQYDFNTAIFSESNGNLTLKSNKNDFSD